MYKKLKESPPQHEFYKMIKAYFAYDPAVKVCKIKDEFASDIKFDIKIFNTKKFVAFSRLLKLTDNFGGLTYTINLVPGNKTVKQDIENIENAPIVPNISLGSLLKDFFAGNQAFSSVKQVMNPMSQRRDVFVVVKPAIVQYWADNIGSCYGFNTETYEQVTKKIFNDDMTAFICTEKAKQYFWMNS